MIVHPPLSSSWSIWHVWKKKKKKKKTLTELFRQARVIFLWCMSNTCITADAAWNGTLHVNCLTCPLHSINNSSLDINIVIPQGTKMSFFRTKGECTWWEDGDMRKERLVRLLSYAVCMLSVLFPFPGQCPVKGSRGRMRGTSLGHTFPEGFFPPTQQTAFSWIKRACVLLAEFTRKR